MVSIDEQTSGKHLKLRLIVTLKNEFPKIFWRYLSTLLRVGSKWMKCPKRNTNLLYGMSKATYQLLYSEVVVITRVALSSLEKNSILIFLVFFFFLRRWMVGPFIVTIPCARWSFVWFVYRMEFLKSNPHDFIFLQNSICTFLSFTFLNHYFGT